MSTDKQGLFVTFEGIDGSGKSTQLQLCAKALEAKGHTVIITRNPGGTQFGEELRQILLHSTKTVYPLSELLLFIADRAQHMDEIVLPALQAGKIILCDRHIDSTLAYQGYGRGLSLDTIQHLNQIAIQTQKPDLTLLFDGEPAALAKRVSNRGQSDRLEREKADFHQRVREGFLTLAHQTPQRIKILNALESIDSLQAQVLQHIQNALNLKGCLTL
jgi:dTMP kinase